MKPPKRSSLTLFLVASISFSLLLFPTDNRSAAEASSPLYIKHRLMITGTPSVWVFAEIINNGTTAVANVSVTTTFYDNQSAVIARITQHPWFQTILPYRRAAVAFYLSEENATRYLSGITTGARYEIAIDHFDYDLVGKEPDLLITEAAADLNDKNATVTGKVMLSYNATTSVRNIIVTAIFYDERGIRAAESDIYALTTPLAPGEVTQDPFVIQTIFITNASDRVACVLSAESPNSGTQEGYATNLEMLFWIKGPRTSTHEVNVGGHLFYVAVDTNSTVTDFSFFQQEKKINIGIDGFSGTTGYCNITLPNDLLGGPYTLAINDSTIYNHYDAPTNGTHSSIYFTYNQDSYVIYLTGTHAFQVEEPPFDYGMIALIVIIVCIIAAAIVMRRRGKRRPHRRENSKRAN